MTAQERAEQAAGKIWSAKFEGIKGPEKPEAVSIFSPAVAELVAIGAAIAANCEPCFKYHFHQARKLGVTPKDVASAVAVAQTVKETPARAVLALAERYVGSPIATAQCSAGETRRGAPKDDRAGKCC